MLLKENNVEIKREQNVHLEAKYGVHDKEKENRSWI